MQAIKGDISSEYSVIATFLLLVCLNLSSCTHTKHTAKPDRKIASNIALELSGGMLQGSSIETAPNIVKDWLGDRVSELEGKNVSWSFKNSREDHIVVDIELQDPQENESSTQEQGSIQIEADITVIDPTASRDRRRRRNRRGFDGISYYLHEPLTMYIDKSIREHELGNYFINSIYQSARIWENNTGKQLLKIRSYGRDIPNDRDIPIKDVARCDGISNIYYDKLSEEELNLQTAKMADCFLNNHCPDDTSLREGSVGIAHIRNSRLNIRTLIFKFKVRRKIVEIDIMVNGNNLEVSSGWRCLSKIKPDDLSHLSYLSQVNRCMVANFMITMLHELGHALGLGHNMDNPMSAMNRIYLDRLKIFETELLHQDDIDAFNKLYNIEED